MKKIFYEKVGRRYVPVSEYDDYLLDSFPKGNHLVMCYPGGSSRVFRIDPALAPMIAAGRFAEDAMVAAINEAQTVRPPRKQMSEDERDAWQHLIDVWGDEARSLTHACVRDIAEAGVKAMTEEADKLMKNEGVRKAYEHFLLMCELAKEHDIQNA